MKFFRKILIANRGEIAVRIVRSAKKLGIRTVAVYSDPDRHAAHVKKADESFPLNGISLADTYLNIDKIIRTALDARCDAIHPGYGFLSENQRFAEACAKNGITFIGPHPEAILLMGHKIEARNFVADLGVPVTLGLTGHPEALIKNIESVPFPVLVKAAAGGGGKGMKIIREISQAAAMIESASREALNYFGNDEVYIEQYIENPRHIEVQILGDNHGNIIHLFERECSIQRRYQKIIEESPSPTLTPEVRSKMCEAAVRIGKASRYNNAGTIEFLTDQNLNFYFLEMNTRIQVEHPVTELVTGVDLVKEQILVAAGNPLSFQQEDIIQHGHAIECRIYAEDPLNNFMPSPGQITLYKEPDFHEVRIDTGIVNPTTIESFYDPMISKLILHGIDRDTARHLSIEGLKKYHVHGLKTNIPYLIALLQHPDFIQNKISTGFCEQQTENLIESINSLKIGENLNVAILASVLFHLNFKEPQKDHSVWKEIGYWRDLIHLQYEFDRKTYLIEILNSKFNEYSISINKSVFEVNLRDAGADSVSFSIGGSFYKVFRSGDAKDHEYLSFDGIDFTFRRKNVLFSEDVFSQNDGAPGEESLNVFSPMPGKVVKIMAEEGQTVRKGDALLIVEAMKMENNVISARSGIIDKINVTIGIMVDLSKPLLSFKE